MRPPIRPLTSTQCSQIARAAQLLLERVGVQITEPGARALLGDAGARLSQGRAYLPGALVEAAIQSAPSHLKIYDRRGQPALTLGGRTSHFGAHVDAPSLLDPHGENRRPCLLRDAAAIARLVDALPRLSFNTASGLVADVPAEIADRAVLARCLAGSRKPVLAMPINASSLADMRSMAALVAGGERALRKRPLLIVYAEPLSPLVHPDDAVEKLLYCAAHGIPLVYSGFAAMGGTAPMSLAGTVAQLCAESLSGLVIHQLKSPGAPFIFGGMLSVMDMRTTVFSYGAPEFQWGNALMAQMAHHFKLPNFGTAGTSDSPFFDGQAVLEATSSVLLASLIGAGLVHDIGLLGSATVVMPEMIVATDEMIALTGRIGSGLGLESLPAALEVIETVGPGGEFLTQEHTYQHFREVWYPDLLYRGGQEAWDGEQQEAFEARVNERTREIMTNHRPDPLPDEMIGALESMVDSAHGRKQT